LADPIERINPGLAGIRQAAPAKQTASKHEERPFKIVDFHEHYKSDEKSEEKENNNAEDSYEHTEDEKLSESDVVVVENKKENPSEDGPGNRIDITV